ncbi:hypothetical protein D3C81_2304320 [compost metagenome]
MYKLNQSMVGLTVIPLEPGGNSGGRTLGGIMKDRGQALRRYQMTHQEKMDPYLLER